MDGFGSVAWRRHLGRVYIEGIQGRRAHRGTFDTCLSSLPWLKATSIGF